MIFKLSLEEVRDLALRALIGCGASADQAAPVAASISAAEADGIHTVGLGYLPTYCEHLRCGKIDGRAEPQWRRSAPAGLVADARFGFAHAAFERVMPSYADLVREVGIAGLAIANSYSAGVLGWFVEDLAEHGFVALAFANASASIAPWGGRVPFFGTNPIAFAVPRADAAPLVIDQSSSTVAKAKVREKAARGEPIPDGWGLDAAGRPTSDPRAVLDGGSMAPAGGYKGAALALIVDIMAAGLTGANWSFEASPFGDNTGGPPRVGQFFVAIRPGAFGGFAFGERIETLFAAMVAQEGVRLPGDRRFAHRRSAAREGVAIGRALHEQLLAYAEGTSTR